MTGRLHGRRRYGTFDGMQPTAASGPTLDLIAVEQEFWPNGGNRDTWMIIDGAQDRRIHFDLVNSHLEYSCLYSGDIAPELEAVAPHLVQLEFNDKYTRELLRRSWRRSWGVFLRSGTAMPKLRRHLRTMLLVNDWAGRRLLFRYYDPRVLRTYLPTCTSDELRTVFGPVSHFWTEDDTGQCLSRFSLTRGQLSTVDIEVAGRLTTE